MGGLAREWTRALDENLVPGSQILLDIVMTRIADPGVAVVEIGWFLRFEAG